MQIILEKNKDAVKLASEFLRAGKLISFAADTVYGIAVDASNSEAVAKLYDLKERDFKKPVAVFVKDIATAKSILCFDEIAKKVAAEFLPGALTLVLKQQDNVGKKIAANLNSEAKDFLGFRIVDRAFVKNLMADFGGILAVSSANKSGVDPASSALEVAKYFSDCALDLVIDGGELSQKIVSTVVKISAGEIEILRQGAIAESLIKNLKS